MKSIHENQKHKFVKPKPNNYCACVCKLEQSKSIYPLHKSKLTNTRHKFS